MRIYYIDKNTADRQMRAQDAARRMYFVERCMTVLYPLEPTTRGSMSKVRGVRFSDKEEEMIDEFLQRNPLIDFSTLSRIAILEFIKNPKINLIPVEKSLRRESDNVRPV